jgi:Dolichyl-phosphate-mannose-protein mannosyltransferase
LWAGLLADDYTMLRTVGRYDGIGWAFTHNDLGQAGSAGHFYRPVWVLWNVGLDRVFGGHAAGFHAGNLLLYAVVTVEVWLLIRRLLGARAAWIGAVAFALFPRHTESVAWISGNTDLVATTLALGALLVLLAGDPPWLRTLGAGSLAGLAALAKEATFALPLLAGLLVVLVSRRSHAEARRALPPLAAIVVVQAAVLVVRTVVLEGVGGYSAYPWSVLRVAGALASDVVAALSPPQLELLRYPWLLVVPVIVGALAAVAAWRAYRGGRVDDLWAAGVGVAFFFVALLPSLNLAVDLNNANGERLLFLPSVGLVIALAALVHSSWSRVHPVVVGAAAALALVLPLHAAFAWVEAGRIADRVIAQAVELGPEGGTLVLLSQPEAYRNAHVFPGSLDAAVGSRGGRFDVVLCLPMQVVDQRSGAVSFASLGDGTYRGTTNWDVPFDFPVLRGSSSSISPECTYERGDGERWPPGLGLVGRAVLERPPRSRLAFFDGRDLRPFAAAPAG